MQHLVTQDNKRLSQKFKNGLPVPSQQ